MTALIDKLIETRENPDENLKNQIKAVLQDCRQNVEMPTLEQVKKCRNKWQSYASTYSEYLIEMRTSLSLKFLDMDKGLKETIEGTKAEVAKVLVEKCDLGGLANVGGADFLVEVASQEWSRLLKSVSRHIDDLEGSLKNL
ncbi:hypothetical protein L2E81_23685 [Planktothrix agardhii 1033]|nr:hypothetical protein [Planktothrix agardhii 1033]